MKLQLITMCLLISSNVYTIDEESKANLKNALTYAKQKKCNEIVIFQDTSIQGQNNFDNQNPGLSRLASSTLSFQNQLGKLEEYCAENSGLVLLSTLRDNVSVSGKTSICYIPELFLPANHNDGDLYRLHQDIDKLKEEQGTIPFIIATTERGTENLRAYLNRQYPNDILVFFPEKKFSICASPFVIVGGVVALCGLIYYFLRVGVHKVTT